MVKRALGLGEELILKTGFLFPALWPSIMYLNKFCTWNVGFRCRGYKGEKGKLKTFVFYLK